MEEKTHLTLVRNKEESLLGNAGVASTLSCNYVLKVTVTIHDRFRVICNCDRVAA